jgi:hypothetical protein
MTEFDAELDGLYEVLDRQAKELEEQRQMIDSFALFCLGLCEEIANAQADGSTHIDVQQSLLAKGLEIVRKEARNNAEKE